MERDFFERLKAGPILFDGATGTMLQRLGLESGGSPDELNLTRPDIVAQVHAAYIDAGSDIITTNTFGANRIKLSEYGLDNRVHEINVASARIAREASAGRTLIAGGLGPTGKFLEPVGDLTFSEAVDIYSEQISGLKEGGADIIIIETMMDIREMKAAIIAAKESSGLPVVATMTFDENMRTVLGTSPEVFAIVGEGLGAASVGANCSLGIEGIFMAVTAMSKVTDLPLIVQANAGVPFIKEGKTIFPGTPAEMANYVPKLLEAGVRLIGGCCGTTPEHIKRVRDALPMDGTAENPAEARRLGARLTSRSRHVIFGAGYQPLIVGERINPTGKKRLAQEIKEGKTALTRKEAKGQTAEGAHILDVNVGVPGIDETKAIERSVFAVNENSQLPIVLDSTDPAVLEAGLKAADGKVLINSVSGEEKKLETILPLVKRYGTAVLGLTLDDSGIPETAEGRLEVARKIMERALDIGIRKDDIVIDCLAMTVSADQKSAKETLKAISLVRDELGLSTILGVSNISFGLPERELVNATFLTMAITSGLNAAIVNPYNRLMMDAYHASCVLLGYDKRAESYIKRCRKRSEGPKAEIPHREKEPTDTASRLKNAIIAGDEDNIVALLEEALKDGWDPLRITNEGLLKGLEVVGRLFRDNIYFLPQVMLSADTMKKAFERLKREMHVGKGPSLGKILMATVEGDIHDIGKNIVVTLLENNGFEDIDLGKNVPSEKIVAEAKKHYVDLVGLSALMTTTVMEMNNVVKMLRDNGLPVVTMVGGAVVTQEFADEIGADGYAKDALEAVKRVKALMKKKAV